MIIEFIDAIRARVGGGAAPSPRPVPAPSPAGWRTASIAIVLAAITTAIALALGIVLVVVSLRTLDRANTTLTAANNASDAAHRREVEQLEDLEQIGRDFDNELTFLQRLNAASARQSTTARAGFTAAVRSARALQDQLRHDLALTKQEIASIESRRSRDGDRASAPLVVAPRRVRLVFTAYARFNGTLSGPEPSNAVSIPARADGSAVTLAVGMRNVGASALLHPFVTAAASYPSTAFVQQLFRAGDPTHTKATDIATGRSASDPYVVLIRVTPNGEKTLHVIVSASGTSENGTPYVTTRAFQATIAEPRRP